MCKPHKALRMTIKVHLKTEEKKRAAADTATPTATGPTPTPATPYDQPEQHSEEMPAQDNIQDTAQADDDATSVALGATDPMAQVDEVIVPSVVKTFPR